MLKKIITVSVSALISSPALAIYGGEHVDWSQNQAMVSPKGSGSICSGTLIASDLVLTAAHCPSDYVQIHTGETISVEKFKRHPNYGTPGDLQDPDDIRSYDIMLLKLESNAATDQVYSLPNDRIAHNSLLTVRGVGLDDNFEWGSLKSAEISAYDFAVGEEYSSSTKDIFLINPITGSVCSGDSGGSLSDSNDVIHGLSQGGNGCEKLDTGLAVYVYEYKDFLVDTIAEMYSGEDVLSYPTNIEPGDKIRIQNLGKPVFLTSSEADIDNLSDPDTCGDGYLDTLEICYMTMPVDTTTHAITPNNIVNLGSDTGGSTGGDTGSNTDGSTGGDTGSDTDGSTGGDTGSDTDASTGGDTKDDTGSDTDTESPEPDDHTAEKPTTSTGGSGGSTGLFSLLGLALVALHRKK